MPTSIALEGTLRAFSPIGLAEMDRVKLQVRMDTKYVFSEGILPEVLASLTSAYRLLSVDGVPGTHYRTLYLDTPGLTHYLDHHNGRTFRSKVRFREYVGSDLCFLEVKRKTGRGGTDKARLRVPGIPTALEGADLAFVQQASGLKGPWVPVLWNRFMRLTLVHHTRHERLTIDRELSFQGTNGEVQLQGICIAELKEERGDHSSPFAAVMRAHGIRPNGMSKYCTGMLVSGLAPKHNAFKEALLRVERLRAA